MTAARPTKNTMVPAASSAATITPQTAITMGLEATALSETATAVAALAGLSKTGQFLSLKHQEDRAANDRSRPEAVSQSHKIDARKRTINARDQRPPCLLRRKPQ